MRPCRTGPGLAVRSPLGPVPILLALLAGAPLLAAGGEAPTDAPPEPTSPPNAEINASPSPPAGGEGRGEGAPPPAPFRDVTAAAGITFVHSTGATGEKLLPETMGGGVAFFDYDGDGDPDLLFVDSAGEHTGGVGAVLYRNDGPGPGGEPRFRDVTEESGLAAAVRTDPEDPFGAFYGMGVAAADYDGDGWIDLYLTAVGPNRLLRNRWGVFEDVTEDAGVAGAPGREHEWSTGAAFFDADGDGDLDLFVCNYLEWSPELDRSPEKVAERTVAAADGKKLLTYGRPQTYRGAHPFLFLNQGDGTFREASEQAGLHVTHPGSGEPVAKALAVAPIDADRDGRTDLFIANDTTRNLFFHNRGPAEDGLPRFEEVGELWGLAYDPHGNTTGAMGVDWGYLTPGPSPQASASDTGSESTVPDLSILIGNFHDEATSLYRAQGDPTFYADEAQQAGIATPTRPALTFGLLLLDYDLDGRLDLLQANGHVEPDIHKIDPQQHYRQPAQLFWNTGETAPGKPLFQEVPPDKTGDLPHPMAGRGATYADIDGDGDLDLALTQIAGPARHLGNDRQNNHPQLRVRLRDRPPNPHALGATVELATPTGTHRSHLHPTRSYLSQVELPLTFGLGTAPQADHLTITWPDGHRQRFRDLPARRTLIVHAP